MIKLWICLAFLAISGNLVICYEDYYDDMFYNSPEYFDIESKDINESKSVEEIQLGKTTQPVKNLDIQDYQFEDNRSELTDDDNFNNAVDTHLNSEKSSPKPNKIDYLTSAEVHDVGIDLNAINNAENDKLQPFQEDILPKNGGDYHDRIFNETNTILNEDTENDFEQNNPVDLSVETIPNLDEIIEETGRLLNETQNSIEDNKSNDVEKKQQIADSDSVDVAFKDLISDLDRFRKTWDKLNDYDDDNLDEDDENIISDDSINESSNDNTTTVTKTITTDEISQDKEETVNKVTPYDSSLTTETKNIHPILYLNDALLASESDLEDKSQIQHNLPLSTEATYSTPEILHRNTLSSNLPLNEALLKSAGDSSSPADISHVTADFDDTLNAEGDENMKDFTSKYKINMITENDMRNAQNVWLTVDTPTVITSPGYPDQPYPTNSTIDWMMTGYGIGIELNITNFAVNGHVGDYLLFKPGGIDESGSTGLIFSYNLRTERRYRFLDVDKMFVRFEAKPGMQLMRGFSFSVRMVVPRPGPPEPEPEPEPVMPSPPATITLNLGGVSLDDFTKIEEKFRVIIADMAAMYIKNNDIHPGINTTLELTQITSRALCFHNWPKFELCAEVMFGVPLVYDDDDDDEEREPRLNADDLTKMWETYSQHESFAERLRSLGITEYQVPNDRGILVVWLVIAGGVVISMAMLAFALWRYSCFEDYTRMPPFSDTESINEKRNLDLYPTPHQTLPPLFSDIDYKWADAQYEGSNKVDLGGYSNKSYMREDIYDLDSDEDAVTASARNTSFSPRDIYSV